MKGEKKSMFLTRLPKSPGAVYRQIDIRLCPTESLPYMLLGNSGDDSLMKLLRWRAMEKGLALNEYGMGKRSNEVVCPPFQPCVLS
jgi:DNA polymerase beta